MAVCVVFACVYLCMCARERLFMCVCKEEGKGRMRGN